MVSTRDDEQGQMTIMILGFAVIILLLTTVVIGASQVFVQQRGIHAAADGAALAGTNGIDPTSIYSEGVGDEVQLDPGEAEAAVQDYLTQLRNQGERQNLSCPEVTVTGDTVTVNCVEEVPVPFLNLVTSGEGHTIRVDVTASSQAQSQG